jgi:hypothetical protein
MVNPVDAGGGVIEDLTTETGDLSAGASSASVGTSARVEPYNQVKDQEAVRGKVALLLIYALIGLVFTVCVVSMTGAQACWTYPGHCPGIKDSLESIKLVLDTAMTAVVGLVGAVTGFYFGAKSGAATDGAPT